MQFSICILGQTFVALLACFSGVEGQSWGFGGGLAGDIVRIVENGKTGPGTPKLLLSSAKGFYYNYDAKDFNKGLPLSGRVQLKKVGDPLHVFLAVPESSGVLAVSFEVNQGPAQLVTVGNQFEPKLDLAKLLPNSNNHNHGHSYYKRRASQLQI
mmetsp:Transcript_10744/g.20405  ORF Transcript_10744/g.20405 Transcript_10744/m.20405 type:complete len:155 (+) Transcript_10744:60-524(+)